MASPVAVFGAAGETSRIAAEAAMAVGPASVEARLASQRRGDRRVEISGPAQGTHETDRGHEVSARPVYPPERRGAGHGAAGSFDRIAVVEQLRCCGVLAALRVARAGYPDRKPFCGPLWSDLRSVCPEMVEVQH